jgi:sugar/nucleoside kinase (ribokinase family)
MRYVNDLKEYGIEIKVQPSAHTVEFENIYAENQDDRSQRVTQKADPFTMEQLDGVDAKIFHLGPLLADDISLKLIVELSTKGKISLDVQGYLREVVDFEVRAVGWPEKAAALLHVSILKADVAELKALTGCATVDAGIKMVSDWGVEEIIVTNGSGGSVIYSDGISYSAPAYPPETIIDATGCGDTYMAGYLYQRSKGAGIQQSGEFAAAMAGLKTAKAGAFTGTEEEVTRFWTGFQH